MESSRTNAAVHTLETATVLDKVDVSDIDNRISLKEYSKYRFLLKNHNIDSLYKKSILSLFSSLDIDYYEREYNKHHHRLDRVKKRVSLLFTFDYVYFCTFTFSDEFINLSYKSKKLYLSRLLNNYYYIANADWGEKNNRFHFHAVIGSNNKIENCNWSYGFSNLKLVNNSSDDILRISKYVNKISNHSIKDSTENYYLITGSKLQKLLKEKN